MSKTAYEAIVEGQKAATLIDPDFTDLPEGIAPLVEEAVRLNSEPSVGKHYRMARKSYDSKVASPEDIGKFPLHCSIVPEINEEALIAELNDATRERYLDIKQRLESRPDPCRLQDVAARHHLLVPAAVAERIAEATGAFVTEEEAASMHAVQFFCVKEHKSVTSVEPTTVLNMDDARGIGTKDVLTRLRPIMHPQKFLENSDYRADMSLETAAALRHLCASSTSMAAFDIKCSYWHVKTAGNFVLRTDDGRYIRVDRMPFGIDNAAERMQIITEAISGHPASARVPAKIPVVVHIDNAAAGALDAQEVAEWCDMVRTRAKRCNLLLNDEAANTPSSTLPFCGIVADSESKKCHLGPKFMVKFADAVDAFEQAVYDGSQQGNSVHTAFCALDFLSLHSRLLYACATLGINTAIHVEALWAHKFARRLAAALNRRALHPQDRLTLARSVINGIRRLTQLCASNDPEPVNKWPSSWTSDNADGPAVVLTTDATPSSWGAVLHRPGHLPRSIGGTFGKELPIHVAETVAVYAAFSVFQHELLHYKTIHLLVDNTTALAAIRNVAQAETVRFIAARLRNAFAGHSIEIAYIKTDDNRQADWASRYFLRTKRHDEAVGTRPAQGWRAAAPATVR